MQSINRIVRFDVTKKNMKPFEPFDGLEWNVE